MKYTQEQFIEKAKLVHGDKYDYSNTIYNSSKEKINITCPKHGTFFQEPRNHLSGCGCNKCTHKNPIYPKTTTKQIIDKAKKIHGNKYDYSLVEYIDAKTKIKIICLKHGLFSQLPHSHISGIGCPKCGIKKRPISTEEFIIKANKVHENKYDYSEVDYINSQSKIKIICPKHGIFLQIPNSHLQGCGCAKCNENGKYNIEEYIKKAKEIHRNKYDYSKTNYINSTTKIDIVCPEHGSFLQQADSHIRGIGCPKCAIIKKTLTKDIFIEKSIKIHGNKYNYDLVEYINTKIKVKIVCDKHGIFEQQPSSHLTGRGCAKCGNTSSLNIVIDKNSFIRESNKIHKNKYDYSLVNYKNTNTKVKIICPKHGMFEQQPNNHLVGKGCGRCGGTKKLNIDLFLSRSNEIHNYKYDYSLVNFINVKTKVKIKCPIHNIIFEQTPNHHMKGVGCPICNESTGEKEIRIFLEKNNIEFERQKTFNGCVNIKKLQFDFFLPKYNICIEFDGLQHYEPIEWFGGVESLKKSKIRDKIKTKYCSKHKIKLIRIKYDENILDKLLFLSDI